MIWRRLKICTCLALFLGRSSDRRKRLIRGSSDEGGNSDEGALSVEVLVNGSSRSPGSFALQDQARNSHVFYITNLATKSRMWTTLQQLRACEVDVPVLQEIVEPEVQFGCQV